MTKVLVYLTVSPVEKIVPILVAKAVAGGDSVWMRTLDVKESTRWNTLFWTYSTATFLPHASEELELSPAWVKRQPLWISSTEENANQARVVVNMRSEPFLTNQPVEKIVEILSPESDAFDAKIAAYETAPQLELCLWRHNMNGTWEPISLPLLKEAA